MNLCEFKATLLYKGSSRTLRAAAQKNPASETKTKPNKTKRWDALGNIRDLGVALYQRREEEATCYPTTVLDAMHFLFVLAMLL